MRVYSCPQCRQTFSPRPALARSTMLAEVEEKLNKRNVLLTVMLELEMCSVTSVLEEIQSRQVLSDVSELLLSASP